MTRRERDVAILAAEGLTNPAIAERLFIAIDTVKGHLGQVFGKLGVTRGSELVREVLRHEQERSAETGR